jgi:hypothetical protein
MTKVVGDIAIEVGADIGPLVREMSRGVGVLDRFDGAAKKLSRGLDRFGRSTMDLGKKMSVVSAGIAAVAGATFALAKNSADAGDAIAKNARAAGVSADYYQELSYAIGQVTDMTGEELDVALVRLTKTIGEAAEGSKTAADALDKLGFSQSQIASGTITTQQAFDAYVAKLDGTASATEAAALSTDLFGKAGARMGGQLIGAGAEVQRLKNDAQSLGLVMSQEALNASEKFGDQVDTLQQSFGAVTRVIGAELLPLFTEWLIPTLQDKVIPAMASVAESIRDWVRWFNDLDPAIKDVVGWITAAFGIGGPILVAIGLVSGAISAIFMGPGAPLVLLAAAITAGVLVWQEWGDDIKAAVGAAIDWISTKFEEFRQLMRRVQQTAVEMGKAIAEAFSVDPEVGAGFAGRFGGLGASAGGGNQGSGEGGAGGAMGGQMMGAAIVNGMVLGAVDSLNKNRETLMATFAQVPQIARDVLGIQSPSTVFAEIGRFLGLGMAQGITDSTAVVKTAMDGMTGAAKDSADVGVSEVLSSLGGLFQGSKKISAGIALVNSWLAFTEVLSDRSLAGQPLKRFSMAAAALASGFNAVKNIKAAQPGGGGAGGVGTAAGASGSAPAPATTMNFTIQNDPFGYGERLARSLASQMNDARRNGSQIIATVSSS